MNENLYGIAETGKSCAEAALVVVPEVKILKYVGEAFKAWLLKEPVLNEISDVCN